MKKDCICRHVTYGLTMVACMMIVSITAAESRVLDGMRRHRDTVEAASDLSFDPVEVSRVQGQGTIEVDVMYDATTDVSTARIIDREAEYLPDEGTMTTSNAETGDDARISLNFKDADLRNIIRLIARVSGINIIAGPEVTGRVTVQLTDVSWEHALSLVLRVNGFAYTREDNIIRVMTPDKMEQEPLSVRVIPVNYAHASELTDMLRPLLTPQRGTLQSDSRANVLIVTDVPSRIAELEKVVERLDTPTPQVLIDVKFIEIIEGETDTQGTDWSPLGDYGVLLDDMLYTFDSQVERTRTRDNQFGTENMVAQRTRGFDRNVQETMAYQLSPDQFRLAISMLLNDNRSRLMSHPKVQTLNNKRATIRVAETRYKPRFTFNRETGTYEISDLEEIYVGITLSVTPHITHDNTITLDIIPMVSALSDVQVIAGFEVPITNVREVDTRVTIQDRYTVAIGGMVNDSWQYTERSLPFFGDLPYVGHSLFTWRKREKRAINLIIFITPTIITPETIHDRFDAQMATMNVTSDGEWHEEKRNYPDWHMLSLREKMLVEGVSTSAAHHIYTE